MIDREVIEEYKFELGIKDKKYINDKKERKQLLKNKKNLPEGVYLDSNGESFYRIAVYAETQEEI